MDNGQWTMDNGQWTMDNGQLMDRQNDHNERSATIFFLETKIPHCQLLAFDYYPNFNLLNNSSR